MNLICEIFFEMTDLPTDRPKAEHFLKLAVPLYLGRGVPRAELFEGSKLLEGGANFRDGRLTLGESSQKKTRWISRYQKTNTKKHGLTFTFYIGHGFLKQKQGLGAKSSSQPPSTSPGDCQQNVPSLLTSEAKTVSLFFLVFESGSNSISPEKSSLNMRWSQATHIANKLHWLTPFFGSKRPVRWSCWPWILVCVLRVDLGIIPF